MRNGTFALSVGLHGAVAVAAFVYAARAQRPDAPEDDLVVVDLTAMDDKRPPPAPAPEPPKAPEQAPKAAPPPRVAPPAPRAASAPPSTASKPPGAVPGGGGMGVLAGDGSGDDGFAMDPTPGDGTGGNPAIAAAPPPPAPAPPPPRPKPKEPTCDDATTKPLPIAKPRAIEYPEAARADGKEGRLLLQLVVAEDGSVGSVQVLSGVHPALDSAAVAAVKTWRFEPAKRCGKAVAGGTYRVARRFELGD